MTRSLLTTLGLAAMFMVVLALPAAAQEFSPAKVERMTIQELKERLDDEKLVVVDARNQKSWDKSATKIKGADHVAVDYNVPQQVRHWNKKWTYVTYCA